MVHALACFAHVYPHNKHIHRPPRGHFRHIHHRDGDSASGRRLLSPDIRHSRGLPLRPHGDPIDDVRSGCGGRRPLDGPAHQRHQLSARIGRGSRGWRGGDKVREAFLWDLCVILVGVSRRKRMDDAAALVSGRRSSRFRAVEATPAVGLGRPPFAGD